MSFSNFLENALLTHLMTTYTVYCAYGTADGLESGSGVAEPSGGSYARTAYGTYTITTVVSGDDQYVSNNVAVTWPTATASQGTITHLYFFDALTGGNFLGSTALADIGLADIVVINGTTVSFPIGDVKIKLD